MGGGGGVMHEKEIEREKNIKREARTKKQTNQKCSAITRPCVCEQTNSLCTLHLP